MNSPPALPKDHTHEAHAVARAAQFASFSAWTMIVLGGISTLCSIWHPVSASFAVSIAVFVCGLIERCAGRELATLQPRAARHLVVNQLAVGVAILAYALWQATHLSQHNIDAVLVRPSVSTILHALPPELVVGMVSRLLVWLQAAYVLVGASTALACVATALWYRSRGRMVGILRA